MPDRKGIIQYNLAIIRYLVAIRQLISLFAEVGTTHYKEAVDRCLELLQVYEEWENEGWTWEESNGYIVKETGGCHSELVGWKGGTDGEDLEVWWNILDWGW